MSSSIVTLSSNTRTMSGLAVKVDKSVGKVAVAGGDSLARRLGKLSLTEGGISFETRDDAVVHRIMPLSLSVPSLSESFLTTI